jgi:hypothetical protein
VIFFPATSSSRIYIPPSDGEVKCIYSIWRIATFLAKRIWDILRSADRQLPVRTSSTSHNQFPKSLATIISHLFSQLPVVEAHTHCSSLCSKLLKTLTLSCSLLNLMDTLVRLSRCVILQKWKAFPLMHAYHSTLSLCASKSKLRPHALKVILRSIGTSDLP